MSENAKQHAREACEYDVIVVGAGFGGLYALHKLRSEGYSVRVLEAGEAIGGTWYWNRYPGARCDIESFQYSYSFSDEIQQEWEWSELYAAQPEILRYINYVADKLDLRRDIELNTQVVAATFDDIEKKWHVVTRAGELLVAPFCVMASGCLSVPLSLSLKGLEAFEGQVYRTFNWPEGGVDLAGKRVGLIGTGSSGIQATPRLAEQADHLTVFQRTPNFSIPAHNRKMEQKYARDWKKAYRERRLQALETKSLILLNAGLKPGSAVTREERQEEFEARWAVGGFGFMNMFTDISTNKEVNDHVAEFVRSKIVEIVRDPVTADKLCPKDYPIGSKRICVDTDYFQTFNRPNVKLVDIQTDPIVTVTPTGVRTQSAEHQFNVLVLATGFDAMTGAMLRIDITGVGGQKLKDKWAEGPRTYLGMAISGFPNMFLITGPGSPSVLSNMVTAVELHVDWIAKCIAYLKQNEYVAVEAEHQAEEKWVARVNELGNGTLIPKGKNSWYMGANVPGKPRVILPFLGGAANYAKICEEIANDRYSGFRFI
ncbi:NAD(P)/FAD-dependent oxidoreductase [Bradyrhizobium sp. 190]|uniref:flavin-containing monooxygenase n=1 Tax=Bradyrhizobium sp. 190 TaxID=2782658 RepID=UPI001FF93E1D|nr:NAD(P)/FAD-dependent oxidoreductase [Bradyrhizobium sp. 190]MCK1513125.1 NAD(P)/FAD-dependent oxidoreductase [Bradyrhizobium sp. 190]